MGKPKRSREAKAFGAEVRRRRQAAGWTLEKLSEKAGLGTNYLSPLENGARDPSLSTITKIAGAFRAHPADLFGSVDLGADALEAARLFEGLSDDSRAEVLRLMKLLPRR